MENREEDFRKASGCWYDALMRTRLEPFARLTKRFPVSLPDRAFGGITGLTAADYRRAAAVLEDPEPHPTALIEALAPFAAAGEWVPERAYGWHFGTSGITYGDFIEAREFYGRLVRD